MIPFDAVFYAEFNSTTFRLNSAKIANPDAKYFAHESEISVFWRKEPFFNGQPPTNVSPFDAEFISAPNSSRFRPKSGVIANRARKYLGDDPRKPVFGVKVIFFDGQPPSKVSPFDAEFNSASNSSRFRPNSDNIANRARKYLGKDPQNPVFGVKVIFFDGQPPSKVPPFDAEFNSASNSSRFRPNSDNIANRAKKRSNMVLTLPTSIIARRRILLSLENLKFPIATIDLSADTTALLSLNCLSNTNVNTKTSYGEFFGGFSFLLLEHEMLNTVVMTGNYISNIRLTFIGRS